MSTARRMDRVWIALGAVVAVVLAALAWFLFISPKLQDKADYENQLANAETQTITLQNRINKLREDASQASQWQAQLKEATSGLPSAHDLDAFTRQLVTQADEAGVTLVSISPGAPSQISMAEAAPMPAGDSTGTDDAGETAAPAENDPKTADKAKDSATGNIYAIAVTVSTIGPIEAQRSFLSLLEKQGPRLALVTATGLSPQAASTPDDESQEDGDAANAEGEATDPAGGNNDNDPGDADGAEDEDTDNDTDGAAGTDEAAVESTWSMTTQLQVYVAPQSPEEEQALSDQLGGNG